MNHVEEFKSIIDNFGKKVQIITESVVYSSKPVVSFGSVKLVVSFWMIPKNVILFYCYAINI